MHPALDGKLMRELRLLWKGAVQSALVFDWGEVDRKTRESLAEYHLDHSAGARVDRGEWTPLAMLNVGAFDDVHFADHGYLGPVVVDRAGKVWLLERSKPALLANSVEAFAGMLEEGGLSRERIIEALAACNHDRGAAAEKLGVHRVELAERMKELGLL